MTEKQIYNALVAGGLSPAGAAGVMGNLQAESGLKANNLQNSYEKKLGMTDAQYTAAVDSGSYQNFVRDAAGYGLAQWTYWSRKQALLQFAKDYGASIGDAAMQVAFLLKELKGYGGTLWATLTTADSVRAASDAVLLQYEKPADQSEAVKAKRAGYGEAIYTRCASKAATVTTGTAAAIEKAVAWAEAIAADNSHGYDQAHRWGPDYDCSALLISAWEAAGVPVKAAGATYTGNMRPAFLKSGFKDVTASVNQKTGSGLQRGDVLLSPSSHTAMFVGNGKIVQASINEKGKTTGGATGDQTGREIAVSAYYNRPFSYVLRYVGGAAGTESVIASAASGVEPAQSRDDSLAGSYTVTSKNGLRMRAGAGTDKPILTVLKPQTRAQNYGYYTKVGSVRWLYVVADGQKGFCSEEFLKKDLT